MSTPASDGLYQGMALARGEAEQGLKPNTVDVVGQIIAQRGLSCPSPTDDIA
jgi:hypothetical protein